MSGGRTAFQTAARGSAKRTVRSDHLTVAKLWDDAPQAYTLSGRAELDPHIVPPELALLTTLQSK
jgi:hypothetical protein